MEDRCRYDLDETVKYYDEHAQEFIDSTIHADVSELYRTFEEHITSGCRILDLGCGSGRDSKYFAAKGYHVVAIDPSAKMCEQTRKLVQIPVYQMRAEDMRFLNEFDAIWACASLLHLPYNIQVVVLEKIARALKPGGIFYSSWKYGNHERLADERMFYDCDEKIFRNAISVTSLFDEIMIWITQDVRNEKRSQRWFNTLLSRKK